MEVIKDKFPRRLQLMRERRRISRLALSQLCGLWDGAVRQYERGEAMPSVTALAALAEYFGCTTDYLLGISQE